MKVLLTGSTGYIGKRLRKLLLQDRDIDLRIYLRDKSKLSLEENNNIEVIEGDVFDKDSLKKAFDGVDTAYYLIHSQDEDQFKELEKRSAQNFIDMAEHYGVKRVIYLGALGVKSQNTSEHILSRIETGEILSSSKSVQTIWLRAGVIIGSGSTSFEIIRSLVEKLPMMMIPAWVSSKVQPIAVEDVLRYLCASSKLQEEGSLVIDIGADQLSYKEMIDQTAQALRLKRTLIPVPFLSINLSSYWLKTFTPIQFNIVKQLIEGLKSEVLIQNDNASKYFPMINPMPYKRAIRKAINEFETNLVTSRWCSANCDDIDCKDPCK